MFEASRQIRPAAAAPGDPPIGLAPLATLDLHKIWSALWRGKTTILCATVAALIAAALVVLIVPHKFTATTEILIDPTDLRAVANDPTPSKDLGDTALLQVESQVRVLTSDSVLRRVVGTEGLDHDPEFASGTSLLRTLTEAVGLRGSASPDKTLAALNELKRHVEVKRAERTYVVDVSVTSRDPAKAVRIANAIAQAYLDEQTEVRSDAARQVSQSLSARLKELQDRVRESEERVEEFKARNSILGANGQLVNEQQLSELNNELSAAHARTAEAKARLDQVEAVQNSKADVGAFPEAVASPTITALRSQYAEIMRREAEQKISLGDKHPAVIEIEAQADRLRHMIEDEVNRIALSARTAYETAKANEEMLSRNLDTLKHTAVTTNAAMVGLRELEREVQASRAVYEAFLVRARETSEQERLDTKNIQIISKADLPQYRSSPPSNLLMALAAVILGMAAGIGIVLMRSPRDDAGPRSDASPPTPGKPSRAAKEPSPAAAPAPAVPVLAIVPGVGVSYGLDAADDPTSRFAMEIRKVHDAVRASHHKRGNPSVLVAASDDADDSAAVALTLAAVAAATEKVLLIDADRERRTLAAIDADQSDAGLVDVAVGRRQLSEVVTRDQDTNINLASFIAPGSRRDRPIKDADVKHAFDQTKRFDMVIVAAMDLSRDPSASFFAGLVDHIVLVTRADESDEGAVNAFIVRLGVDARKVRGAVLTGADAR